MKIQVPIQKTQFGHIEIDLPDDHEMLSEQKTFLSKRRMAKKLAEEILSTGNAIITWYDEDEVLNGGVSVDCWYYPQDSSMFVEEQEGKRNEN